LPEKHRTAQEDQCAEAKQQNGHGTTQRSASVDHIQEAGPGMRKWHIRYCRPIVAVAILTCAGPAPAAEKGTRFWNLTGETITHLSLAPTGTTQWGPDQCRNDPDGSVDFDERLRITGVSSGRYDARFTDRTGRTCTVTAIDIKAGAVFSIDKEALKHCAGK
jgi:hypothetical protein